jgi:hypothetical protein
MEVTEFRCSVCGKTHQEWPALAFDSPTAYNVLSDKLKHEIAELTNDFCTIHHPEQTDRFIRGTLTLKVIDSCQDFEYGVWVSLSEKSFQDYSDNYDDANHAAKYFGWLSNDIPDYGVIASIPTTVFTRINNQRPEIVPHSDFDHQLVYDYYNGIARQDAEMRIREMLKRIADSRKKNKAWWKFW